VALIAGLVAALGSVPATKTAARSGSDRP